jgi:hypothetical protein
MRVAAKVFNPLELRELRTSGIFLQRMRKRVEYVCNWRKMSGLLASIEMDNVPALFRLGFARGLVSKEQ